jgi:hypothetical protein
MFFSIKQKQIIGVMSERFVVQRKQRRGPHGFTTGKLNAAEVEFSYLF